MIAGSLLRACAVDFWGFPAAPGEAAPLKHGPTEVCGFSPWSLPGFGPLYS
jgi:hypothetical protein